MSEPDCDAAVRRYYSDPGVVRGYAAVGSQGLVPFEAAMIRRAFAPGQHVLDVGCGGGREAIPMATAGIQVTAMDFILPMVGAAVAYADTLQVRLRALAADVTRLPFRDRTFDGATMVNQIIAFVPTRAERIAALRAIWRVLRPGGMLVMTTHNRRCQWKFRLYFACANRWRRVARRLGHLHGLGDYDRWSVRDKSGHPISGQRLFLHMYDLNEVLGDLREAGFEVVDARSRAEFEADQLDLRQRRRDYLLGFIARRPGDHDVRTRVVSVSEGVGVRREER